MTTPRHCPGFEQFKSLKAFTCKCPNCGKEKEIFSDEFDRKHVCSECVVFVALLLSINVKKLIKTFFKGLKEKHWFFISTQFFG
jgi:hypothetical protein